MASLAELARKTTDLQPDHVAHLQGLVTSWGLLADFSFADLLLFAPERAGDGSGFVVLSQKRPTTSQTLYRVDLVGTVIDAEARPLVARAYRLGEIIEEETTIAPLPERVRMLGIPVRHRGDIVAVLTRESPLALGRHQGELERTYVGIFSRFAQMIAAGEYPYSEVDSESYDEARVGDGVILLDDEARVVYTSPNSVSALHRLGVHRNAEGMRLGELGLDEDWVHTAFSIPAPASQEIEVGSESTVLFRAVPLLDKGRPTGAVLLVRDISELRRRDRLLLSKDATIREIHHRVKNNLQTISSLLRLQGRRLASPEAKEAIEESVRRVRSIALVHETLSREAGEDVPFIEIVKPLVRMVEEGFYSVERPVRVDVQGDAGKLPAAVATPLAVVLTELIQNTVDHAYPDGSGLGGGRVMVSLDNDGHELTVRVSDDGVGPPPGFSLDDAPGLGLSIVRTLVTSELDGTITMSRGDGTGDDVTDGDVHPVSDFARPGMVVELHIPVDRARS